MLAFSAVRRDVTILSGRCSSLPAASLLLLLLINGSRMMINAQARSETRLLANRLCYRILLI